MTVEINHGPTQTLSPMQNPRADAVMPPVVSRRAFLKTTVSFAAIASGAAPWLNGAAPAARGPLMAYVGTYSSPPVDTPPGKVDLPPGNGRGIHLFRVDRTTGALSPAGVFPLGTSPNCLAFNSAGTRLYSTNATDLVENGSSGTISAFAVNRNDGQLTLLNTVSSGGVGPTYLSVHPAGKHVLVANYAGGTVAVFPLLPDGRLGPASDIRKNAGTVGPKRAASAPPGSFAVSGHDFPHPHMIEADASGRFIVSADL